ncbi:glycerate kinase [Leifsonia poae]|uniref:glycerate kinase n=1 Tax=Leifsonia poae TaxID=110933 RepID=UPI001CC05E7D|nr:glycerate kinase [Leifsonia poae]
MPYSVVFAPDSFKGSASAASVAAALAEGWSSVRPGDRVLLAPMADGGEGTLDAFELAVPGSVRRPIRVTGPVGVEVDASWLLLPDGTALVELAETSGLGLLTAFEPLDATTAGFGQAIAEALAAGATRLLLAIGGSSSTDGGAGALVALGARLLDAEGRPICAGGRGLADLVTADLTGLPPLPPRGVRILSDVTNPLLGSLGAAAVFGPQKGADAGQVAVLEAALTRFAAVLGRPSDAVGSGAAGGTGYGLLAWGAVLAPGAEAVGDALGLPRLVTSADAVVTGEGRFDSQSAAGKVPDYVSGLARAAGLPAYLAAGSIEAPTDSFAAAASLSALAGGSAAAIADATRWARVAGAELAATVV